MTDFSVTVQVFASIRFVDGLPVDIHVQPDIDKDFFVGLDAGEEFYTEDTIGDAPEDVLAAFDTFKAAELEGIPWRVGERFVARFYPQAWVRDNAIEVDPEGDTEWDVTIEFATLPSDYRAMLLEEIDRHDEALDRDDVLKGDPNAPEWVREWQGPFSIYVRRVR